uniref:Uncharacterized protein n=1 Tax=Eutreptiella gymnastica TaxID=73025 RepID=A0A7S4FKH4_9EUGL
MSQKLNEVQENIAYNLRPRTAQEMHTLQYCMAQCSSLQTGTRCTASAPCSSTVVLPHTRGADVRTSLPFFSPMANLIRDLTTANDLHTEHNSCTYSLYQHHASNTGDHLPPF